MSGRLGTRLSFSGRPALGRWSGRWQAIGELLGGAFVLAVWLALWTLAWAAVAGPLSPARAERPAAEGALADGRAP